MPKSEHPTFRLSAEFIEHLHDVMISKVWPQTDPIAPGEYRDKRLLESAAARPFQSAFGQDAYTDVTEKAGALFHSLVANHCFHNGNKRTAVLALDNFLLANGHLLVLDDIATYELARSAASYKEQGRTHTQVLQEIVTAIRAATVPFAILREDPASRRLLDSLRKYRRSLRLHPLNRQQPK